MKNFFFAMLLFQTSTIFAQRDLHVNKSDLLGKWKIDSTQDCHSFGTDSFTCFNKTKEKTKYILDFKKNGTYVYCAPIQCYKGSYKIKNDRLIMKTKNRKLSEFLDQNCLIENLSADKFVFQLDSSTEAGPIKITEYCIRIK